MKPHLFFLLLLVATTGCDAINNIGNERRDCSPGYPYVANPKAVPDTLTISLSDKNLDNGWYEWKFYTLDIFKHTDPKVKLINYATAAVNSDIAFPGIGDDGLDKPVLLINLRNTGNTKIFITTRDDCDKSATINFFIKVTL